MPNKITIYCAAKEGKAFLGTKQAVLSQVCTFWFSDKRQLCVKFKGYKTTQYHSYSKEYSESEMYKDAIQFLFDQLPKYGFYLFKSI